MAQKRPLPQGASSSAEKLYPLSDGERNRPSPSLSSNNPLKSKINTHTPSRPLHLRFLSILFTIVLLGSTLSLLLSTRQQIEFRTRLPSPKPHLEKSGGGGGGGGGLFSSSTGTGTAFPIPRPAQSAFYFANKRNFFNQVFVKKGWGWTTLAFFGLVVVREFLVVGKIDKGSSSSSSGGGRKRSGSSSSTTLDGNGNGNGRPIRTQQPTPPPSDFPPNFSSGSRTSGPSLLGLLKALRPWLIATLYWYFFTTWLFGPSFSDRVMIASGGKCVPSSLSSEALFSSSSSSPSSITSEGITVNPEDPTYEKLGFQDSDLGELEPIYCASGGRRGVISHLGGGGGGREQLLGPLLGVSVKDLRPYWKGGHDVSGHAFLLSMSALFLFSAVIPSIHVLFPSFSPSSSSSSSQRQHHHPAHKFVTLFSLALIGLWTWMLFMTSLFFHNPIEKMTGFLTGVIGWALAWGFQ